jgi:lipid-binding SYLF domain-containing protein
MIYDRLEGSHSRIAKSFMHRFLASALIVLILVPVWAVDKSKDEETLKHAAIVLERMIDDTKFSADVVARADCVIVFPAVKKNFDVGTGGSSARGPMICREGKNFSGRWTAPAIYTIGGVTPGPHVGGLPSDFVLLITSRKGVDAVLKGKTRLSNEAIAAAGLGDAPHAGTAERMDILTYAGSSGLYAETSFGAATLEPDEDANQRLYDKALTAKEIVIGNDVKLTAAGKRLISLLNTRVSDHSSP